jgi:hypothetical protein
VQLDVLARAVHELQQPVDNLVLADALVANQKQVLAKRKVSHLRFNSNNNNKAKEKRIKEEKIKDEKMKDQDSGYFFFFF